MENNRVYDSNEVVDLLTDEEFITHSLEYKQDYHAIIVEGRLIIYIDGKKYSTVLRSKLVEVD